MQPTFQLETLLNNPGAAMKLQALINDMRWRVQLLDSDIHEEENRTGIFDFSHFGYSILARNLRARRDNLLGTITVLESQFAKKEIAASR